MLRASLGSAHHHRESIVDPQRIQPFDLEPSRIFGSNTRQHSRRIVVGRVLQNRGQGRAGVFRIEVDFLVEQGPMRQQRAAQVQLPLHFLLQPMFQMLRDDLAEDHLLGEVLRSDADARIAHGPKQRRDSATSSVRAAIIFVRPIPIPSLPQARSTRPVPLRPESAPCPPTRRRER